MRKSARTQIPPFFDNDPYTLVYTCVLLFQRYYFSLKQVNNGKLVIV